MSQPHVHLNVLSHDNICESVCSLCSAREDRIAALERQLAEVTAERDALVFASHMPSDYAHGVASWINQELYASYIGAKISPTVSAQIESGQLTFPNSSLYKERDALRTALRQCAEALREAHDDHYRYMSNAVALHIGKALADPVVQEILREE